MKVAIVIPTKNEEKTIASVITGANAEIQKNGHTMVAAVVVDDSHDKTREIAASHGADVVIGGGKGLGAAMFKGLKRSLLHSPDIVISIDGDGQVDLSEITIFLNEVMNSNADLVLGSRFKENDLVGYKYRSVNMLGTRILVAILRNLTGLPLTDSHGGIRAIRPAVIRELELIGTHTYVQETIIDAHENGFKIQEIPSRWNKREFGSSRVVFSIPKYVFYTLPVLVMRAGQHIKFLFPLGIALIILALIHLTVVSIITGFSLQEMFNRQTFHLFFLLLSTGANLFFFGFALEMLAHIKRKAS